MSGDNVILGVDAQVSWVRISLELFSPVAKTTSLRESKTGSNKKVTWMFWHRSGLLELEQTRPNCGSTQNLSPFFGKHLENLPKKFPWSNKVVMRTIRLKTIVGKWCLLQVKMIALIVIPAIGDGENTSTLSLSL